MTTVTSEIIKLYDMLGQDGKMQQIQRELEDEWGPYGPADMREMHMMAENAGHMIYVIQFASDDGIMIPSGILQTGRAPIGGDYRRLIEVYPTFNHIVSNGTWEESNNMRGDTALLLQITAFGERSQGVGSLLRDGVFRMMPDDVLYALTTTPVPKGLTLEGLNEMPHHSYPPAVRFHYNGGGEISGHKADYKVPQGRPNGDKGRQHYTDVKFLKYTRRQEGWVLRRAA